jgi:hypothetical protein
LTALIRRRVTTFIAIACALMLGALAFGGTAGATTTARGSCEGSAYAQIDGRCVQVLRTEKLNPAASAAFEKLFAAPGGRAAVQRAIQAIDGASSGVVFQERSTNVRPAWNCPGGASCGVSSSGGWHFWAIVSYAAIYDAGTVGFWAACTGALSPFISPTLAWAACGVVAGALWSLVNNAPWTSHHGVWIAVHPTWWTGGTW